MEKIWIYLARIKLIMLNNSKGLMSILMVWIQIYIIKWLSKIKIYIICKYRILTIDLMVNRLTFFYSKFEKNYVNGIFKLLYNENIKNDWMAQYSSNILLICKRRNGFIFFSFWDMQSQSGANLNFKFSMHFR